MRSADHGRLGNEKKKARTAELHEPYERLSLIQKLSIMDEGRHLWKLFTVWGGRRMNRWPFPLWRWQSRVTLQNCQQPRIFQQQTDTSRCHSASPCWDAASGRVRARVLVRVCCNCALAWQVWINERYVSREGGGMGGGGVVACRRRGVRRPMTVA